jgi:tripartite-type tricarboxylate transporter receptor subunit TctC
MNHNLTKISRRELLQTALGGSAILATPWLAQSALAQTDWPSKPVRIVNPFPAGSPFDVVARHAADKLQKATGQTFLVESRSGAGGTIGTAEVSRLPADGYTLLVHSSSMMATAEALYTNLSYDIVRDFQPLWAVQGAGFVLVVRSGLPVNSIQDFIAYAKANPGKVSFGSAGNGTLHHLSGEVFQRNTGTKLVHVPYRGAVPAENDLMAGHVDCIFDAISGVVQHVAAGKMKALAVLRNTRAVLLPDVPTMQESGVADMALPPSSIGLYVRTGTPAIVRDKVTPILGKAFEDDKQMRELFGKMGLETVIQGEQTSRMLVRERDYFGPLIKQIGLTAS